MAPVAIAFALIWARFGLVFADEIPEEQCVASAPTTDFGLDEQDKHTMVLLQETSLIQFQSLAAARAEGGAQARTEATAAAMADLRAAIKMTSKLRQHFGPQVAKDTWHAALAEVQSEIAQHDAQARRHQADGSTQGTDTQGNPNANGQVLSGATQAMFQAPNQQQFQQQPVSLAYSSGAASEMAPQQAVVGQQQAASAGPHQPQASPASMHQAAPVSAAPGPVTPPGAAPPKGSVMVARIAPFGKEDTATELTKHAERTQDTLVDAVENAEVAEVKRAVFRALTRLRAASIKEFDTIARLETQAIDEYNDAHHYRAENPLSYLHSSEARVTEDKYTSFH